MAGKKIIGADKLLAKFRALPKAVRDELEKATPAAAEETVAMMQRLAPRGKTGNLVQSIRTERKDDLRVLMVAGGTAQTRREIRKGSGEFSDEAFFAEFGTKAHKAGGKFKGARIPAIPPRPFFFPAWRAMKKRVKAKLSRSITTGIKKVAKGGR
jgi:HK97 gp10 family phage protein